MTASMLEKIAGIFTVCLLAGALCVWLTGCGTTSGWRVSFGVAPVASLNENQTTLDKRTKD